MQFFFSARQKTLCHLQGIHQVFAAFISLQHFFDLLYPLRYRKGIKGDAQFFPIDTVPEDPFPFPNIGINSSNAYEGSKSFASTNRTASWNGVIKKLDSNFSANNLYSFSVNVKYTDGSGSQKFRLGVQYTDFNGQTQYTNIAETNVTKGQWKQISNQYFYMPWGGKDFSLFVETESGTSSFYIDQAVGAKQGTYIQGAN